MLRYRHGGGIGQLVGGAYHEGFKGELIGGKAVPLLFLPGPLEFLVSRGVQDDHFKIHGEDVLQGGLDVLHKEGLHVPFLEIVGAVEPKGIPLDINRLQFVEPGVDGGLR